MLVVQCKDCRKEISSHPSQARSCGCPIMTSVKGDSVTAVALTRVVMVQSSSKKVKDTKVLSDNDLMFQEQRRKRKVRRLDFEIR